MLISKTQNVTLFGSWTIADVISKLKIKSIEWSGPYFNTAGVLIRWWCEDKEREHVT